MNVIIFSAATGGGHNRAANALKEYILSQDPSNKVQIVDFLEVTSKVLNTLVTVGYKQIAKNAPEFFGFIYRQSDNKKKSPTSAAMKLLVKLTSEKIIEVINEVKPDIIVSCHPFATNMMSYLKVECETDVPVIGIVTDFTPHQTYIGEKIDAYVTASDRTSNQLIKKYGVSGEIVHTTGLPVFEKFYNSSPEKNFEVYESLGFDPNKHTLLIMAGSFGVNDILEIYENIVSIEEDFQIIVITGKNQHLYDAFEKIIDEEVTDFDTYSLPSILQRIEETDLFRTIFVESADYKKGIVKRHQKKTTSSKPTQLLYFVDNVEDYMHISDVIITKPGGLTTSESIACSLPMALFDAIPGQEEANAKYLCDKGMAIKLKKGKGGAKQIKDLFTHPEKLNDMKANCRLNFYGDGCENIYNLMKDFVLEEVKDEE